MLVNKEQDNTIEGEYLKVISGGGSKKISLNITSQFFINNKNSKNWLIGWGHNKPLYDAGCENLRAIDSIDIPSKTIFIGRLLKGIGYPQNNQRIIFWNINPSGFIKEKKETTIKPSAWPQFKGKSVGFGSIIFDSLNGKWTMFINEEEANSVQVYAAISDDLKNWSAANNGKPVMTIENFKNISWAVNKKNKTRTPVITDVIKNEGKWYFFMNGINNKGKKCIGLAIAEKSIFGPYNVLPQPLICSGEKDNRDYENFYAKVSKYKNGFIMFYDRKNSLRKEYVGLATSDDLIHWNQYDGNPVLMQHSGWRSSLASSEPVYIEIRKDSIFMMVMGAKQFKMGLWHHYITGKIYMDRSGNVNDNEMGVYLSTDGGKTFIPHKNNPVFINNYSDIDENDHLGGNFELIKTDTADYIFYQAKTDFDEIQYNIFYRVKKK